MIAMEVMGADSVTARLLAAGGNAQKAARSALDVWSAQLAAYIKESKLSGDPIHRRTGALSRSIFPRSGETPQGAYGGAGGGAGIPYAQALEFGSPAHEIVAKNVKALCFDFHGVKTFAKRVSMPEQPAKSYMRSAFREKVPDGVAALRAAVLEAIGVTQ